MANSRTHRRRIGEILTEEGMITSEQLHEALSLQRQTGELLGVIMMDMGLVTESDVAKIVSIQYQLPFLSLKNYDYDASLVEKFDSTFLHRHQLLPFDQVGQTLLVVVTEIPTEAVLAEIPARSGLNAALFVGFSSEVERELTKLAPLSEEEKGRFATARAHASGATTASGSPSKPSDEDDNSEEARFGQENPDFMSELDSTWDSIFDQLDTAAETTEDGADEDSTP